MSTPLSQIHPSVILPVISRSKQSRRVVLIYLCVCMQAQACHSTHVRRHLAGAGSPPRYSAWDWTPIYQAWRQALLTDQDFLTDLFFWCLLFVYLFCGYRFSVCLSGILTFDDLASASQVWDSPNNWMSTTSRAVLFNPSNCSGWAKVSHGACNLHLFGG